MLHVSWHSSKQSYPLTNRFGNRAWSGNMGNFCKLRCFCYYAPTNFRILFDMLSFEMHHHVRMWAHYINLRSYLMCMSTIICRGGKKTWEIVNIGWSIYDFGTCSFWQVLFSSFKVLLILLLGDEVLFVCVN